MMPVITAHDDLKRHCPMLGHELTFAYCRSPGSDLPCRKILDCWFRAFDIQAFLREHFSQEDIDRVQSPRPDKILSLMELIQQAQARQSSN